MERKLYYLSHIEHVIHYEVGSHFVGFKIWRVVLAHKTGEEAVLEYLDESSDTNEYLEDPTEALLYMIGTIKWDGCVNIAFPDHENCMLHFCGPEEEPELGRLMKAVYRLGPEMETWMP